MNNDQAILDTRNLITGKDGQVFVTTSSGNTIFLAEVDTFKSQLNVKNTDVQPVGSMISFAVPTGYTVAISYTEMVIRDDVMMEEIFEDLQKGYLPTWDFQGKLNRRDGQVSRQVYRNCVLDGSLDLMNITPGDVIKRAMSFRCNAIPEMLALFATV
ncbi:phage tail tube protein [Acetobacterium tundrae]|uniref:Uncharacterized protein n=1 Tax=Acetobacterium tundrae TaxID=132932 RepID=A0ABR6WPI1_9FIRM|nr:phage tail tube protein [Acetobacterium tundrae]MBC3798027.1 hypothetical protein [Acetobacterium tundrae]